MQLFPTAVNKYQRDYVLHVCCWPEVAVLQLSAAICENSLMTMILTLPRDYISWFHGFVSMYIRIVLCIDREIIAHCQRISCLTKTKSIICFKSNETNDKKKKTTTSARWRICWGVWRVVRLQINAQLHFRVFSCTMISSSYKSLTSTAHYNSTAMQRIDNYCWLNAFFFAAEHSLVYG